jgi:hypothetical protein
MYRSDARKAHELNTARREQLPPTPPIAEPAIEWVARADRAAYVVVPAQAGIRASIFSSAEKWIAAFTETTI